MPQLHGAVRLRLGGAVAVTFAVIGAGVALDHATQGVQLATKPSALERGQPVPSGLSTDERRAWNQLDAFYRHGLGYAQEMANRPQTLYATADSPVGLAAWMLDHDERRRR